MTIGRVTMLTNPASGHGSAPHAAERAVTQLHKRGIDVVAIAGTDAEHARRLVEGALERDMDALVVVGGDGIVSLALQVLAGTDIPLGIIPSGTGNDHAREFGIPAKDPEAAADVIVDGVVETVDLGRIRGVDGTDKWFGTVMAAGFDSWSPTGPTGCGGRTAGCATTSRWSPRCPSCGYCPSVSRSTGASWTRN